MTKNNQSLQQANADLHKHLCSASDRARELDRRASDAVECMLKTFLSPAAFYALETFHRESDRAEGYIGMSFLDALESLGSREGVEEFARTLGRLKTNPDFL